MAFGDPWTSGQRAMAALIDKVVAEHSQWPRFDYLEHELHLQGLNAHEIFDSFGVLRDPTYGSRLTYSDITTDHLFLPHDESRVGLSVAGYFRLRGDDGPAGVFLHMLTAAGNRRIKQRISPIEPTSVDWTGQDFSESVALDLAPSLHWLMTEFIKSEPRALTGLTMRTGFTSPDTWTAQIGAPSRNFAGPTAMTPMEYISHVQELLSPPPVPQPRVMPSPLSLLTAVDYLNVTWLLHCRRPALRLPEVFEPVALLAADVADKDELGGRLSTIADLLKTMAVHDLEPRSLNSAHPLRRMESYLNRQGASLDEEDRLMAAQALERLHHVKEVRNGLLHNEGTRRAHESWLALGLPHPPADWNALWHMIRSLATESILELRSVVTKLPRDACRQHVT